MEKINRNDKCPCGSGKKYKSCCLPQLEAQRFAALSHLRETCGIPHGEPVSTAKAIFIAVECQKSGQLQRAETVYENVLKLEPENQDVLFAMALIAQSKDDKDAAVNFLVRCLNADPGNYNYCIRIGSIYNSLGMPEKAQECFQSIKALIANTPQDQFNLGNLFNNLGELDEAIVCYEQALRAKPDFGEAHFNLGTVHLKKNELAKAVECLQTALKVNPSYSKAHNNLGYTLSKMGDLDGAIDHYKKALSISPDFAQAHYNLGNALKEQGLTDEAMACFEKTRELQPTMPELAEIFK
ncbi:hypothetical protein GMLC_40260 [Geomonas limicola]|uniref:Uncharacterized protein n=1 Tax=Geomonas limicola TaxID=2740186 RepID=A0A6V8NF83_9BACT|nr:tetratricopeptide repeat protein [Geomonas limicola]GFO70447.1 hypothetical protein GMLC_40260 [Geomonas limicola]